MGTIDVSVVFKGSGEHVVRCAPTEVYVHLQQQQGPRFPAPGDGACSDTAETLKETERDADIAGETGTGTPKQPRREQQV